jgi:hypothetical protein
MYTYNGRTILAIMPFNINNNLLLANLINSLLALTKMKYRLFHFMSDKFIRIPHKNNYFFLPYRVLIYV